MGPEVYENRAPHSCVHSCHDSFAQGLKTVTHDSFNSSCGSYKLQLVCVTSPTPSWPSRPQPSLASLRQSSTSPSSWLSDRLLTLESFSSSSLDLLRWTSVLKTNSSHWSRFQLLNGPYLQRSSSMTSQQIWSEVVLGGDGIRTVPNPLHHSKCLIPAGWSHSSPPTDAVLKFRRRDEVVDLIKQPIRLDK